MRIKKSFGGGGGGAMDWCTCGCHGVAEFAARLVQGTDEVGIIEVVPAN